MKELLNFLFNNKEWLFSGVAIVLIGIAVNLLSWMILKLKETNSQVYLQWLKRNSQWFFSGIGVAAISLVIGIASNIYVDKIQSKTNPSDNYISQLEKLNDISNSISNLNDFVNVQKQKLKESQDVLISLKKEHDTLKPIVETEREVIKKIFAAQSQIAMENIWKERVVSFFLGILASVVASFIYGLFQRFYKENNKA